MAGIDPQRKALIDVLNQKEQERLAKQPPPSPLSQALAAAAKPFQGYFDRQGKLAREGWDQANMGAEQLRAGDLPMGAANALLGPVNWLTSGINALLPEEQATRDFGRSVGGNFGEAAAAGGLGLASMMLPGPKVKGVAKLADEAAEGITAYHGSPHTFDKFSMDKIGTGEGAQAYGHGLYFAENEAVAKGYRDTLSKGGAVTVDGKPTFQVGNVLGASAPGSPERLAARRLQEFNGDVDEAIKAIRADAPASIPGAKYPDTKADDAVKFLEANREKIAVNRNPGATYQVRLNVKPDELLDWDRPLSEQPQTIRDALKASGAVGPKQSDWSMPGGKVLENMKTDPTFAADMRASGVKGIRYKDAGSRSAEGGTSNFVIFDADLITILKRYGIPMTIGAGGLAMVNGEDMPPDIASQIGG